MPSFAHPTLLLSSGPVPQLAAAFSELDDRDGRQGRDQLPEWILVLVMEQLKTIARISKREPRALTRYSRRRTSKDAIMYPFLSAAQTGYLNLIKAPVGQWRDRQRAFRQLIKLQMNAIMASP
jgi:hypothetical protein